LNIQQIETSLIVEDPDQPRQHHNEESLRGLADSIRQHGMLNPITVTPLRNVNRYKIITGERRWRAAQMVHLDTIPCIVKDVDAESRLTEQLIENLQREDLQPLEKARAIQHVKESLTLTNREVSRRLGLSERTVGYLLDLLALPEDIGEAIVSSPNRPADGQITEKHARHLKQLNESPELQSAVVERIREEKLSSDDTGNLVRALRKRPDQAKEILDSPTDHLVRFFGDSPLPDFGDDASETPSRLFPTAQRIIDFLPTLSGLEVAHLSHPELRQMEDALTSLQLAVNGLLKSCKDKLES
jgi:ParB family transcriptional regulator, chromosome partitioning protein